MDSLELLRHSPSTTTYTEKQKQLIEACESVLQRYGIKIVVNATLPADEEPISFDIEHDEQGNFVCCGFYSHSLRTVYSYFDISILNSQLLDGRLFVGHNAKTDIELLQCWGVRISQEDLYWDTQLISHILDSSLKNYGLKPLAESQLQIVYPSYDDIVGNHKKKCPKNVLGCCGRATLEKQPRYLTAVYNACDCLTTHMLYSAQKQCKGTSSIPAYFTDLEKPVSVIFQDMENRGVRIDITYLTDLQRQLEVQFKPLDEKIRQMLGVENVNSDQQVIDALAKRFNIKLTLKGKPTRSKVALEKLKGIEVVDLLLRHSEIGTLLDTFVYKYQERNTSVVHPFFNQCGTRTGRPSCSNPNLLQIPQRTENGKRVRRMFIPRDGMLMGDCDFGQIEPRVLAHLSKDPVLCQMFNDGVDFHTFTAERLGIARDRAKVLNLSVGYRATKFSVQRQLGGTLDDAQREIDKWWSLFPALRRWQESIIFESKRSGFCTTLLGRRIRIDGLANGNSWKREAAERQLINNIAQGSAAEIMKKVMIKIHADLGFGAFQATTKFGLLVQVYDELLFEADSRDIQMITDEVKKHMCEAVELDVPLTVNSGIGPNWAEAKL